MNRAYIVELGDFEHSMHISDMELECSECHGEMNELVAAPSLDVCTACH